MLIDTHAHLDYEYDVSLDELLREANDHGVTRCVAIAAAPDSLERVKELAEQRENLYFTTGIHPHDAVHFSDAIFAQMKSLILHPKCVAVGELGLDYYYEHSDHDTQKTVLQRQLEFSVQMEKPVVFHSRDAEDDTIALLAPHAKAWKGKRPPGVIHCFTGSRRLAEECLAMGYFISFSGIITFKNADPLREIVRDVVPSDRLLVETDSPYLAPVPHRGKKNHPAYTRIVAEKVAELKGVSFNEIAACTTANAKRLFGI